MIDMFENYQNIPNDYIPHNTSATYNGCGCCYSTPHSYKKPREEYDGNGNIVSYSWDYGDSVELQFNIEGDVYFDDTESKDGNGFYMSAEDFIKGKALVIKIYNYRYEVIFEKRLEQATTTAKLYVDGELSQRMKPGVYYGSLALVETTPTLSPSEAENTESTDETDSGETDTDTANSEVVHTLIDYRHCRFVVRG